MSLENIWQSWFKFRSGKKHNFELDQFAYNLENNLYNIYRDLNRKYIHGSYRYFTVCDNKKRRIAVASVRDRVVHRLIYEYLVKLYDRHFTYDVWSNRKDKGLVGAIERTQALCLKYKASFVWRTDIEKYFDSVKHRVLLQILSLRIKDVKALSIISQVIQSFSTDQKRQSGIPIGNLTSQIFANVYLHELDRFILNHIKPQAYLRYGDDFFIMMLKFRQLSEAKKKINEYLKKRLSLTTKTQNSAVLKVRHGLRILGVKIWPYGRRLNRRNILRARQNLNLLNSASYLGIAKKHHKKLLPIIQWQTKKLLEIKI